MTAIIRDPKQLNPFTEALWIKQEGIIIIYNLPFRLFETFRTHERQVELLNSNPPVTWTQHSKHEDGDAWDVAKNNIDGWSWKEEDIFWYQVLGILTINLISGLRWGADWNGKNFWFDERTRDYGHYERIEK